MMAKMFYTLDETKAALGRNEEEIKQLAREGRLREFRDGQRLMFKADQVEQLKAELGGGDAISLNPIDSGAPIGMVDSRSASGSGSVLSLADSQGSMPPKNPGSKEDTAFADIGLSGTIGGVPSPGRMESPSTGTRTGVTIFDVDESQRVDPSAQTAIGSGIQDQVNLEGVGSGSGLLDLTRESDDTSLGAVFDELSPASRRQPVREPAAAGSGVGMDIIEGKTAQRAAPMGAPIYVEQADPSAPAFAAMALAATLVLAIGAFLLTATVLDFRPALLETLKEKLGVSVMIAFVTVIVFGVVGFFIGKATTK